MPATGLVEVKYYWTARITYPYNCCFTDELSSLFYSYRAAMQAKKERTSKAAAGFGAKVKHYTNPKEVLMLYVCNET